MLHFEFGEEQCDDGDQRTHQQAANHPTGHVTNNHRRVRHRRHQHFLYVAGELGAKERRYDVAVRVSDHRHHDQPRRDVLHVVVAVHRPDTAAD